MLRPVVQDTFEDAVDNASVRSLTKRKPSLNRQTTNSPPVPDVDDEASPGAMPDAKPDSPERKKSLRISQTSVTGLDTVNLDDDQAAPSPVPGKFIGVKGFL